MGFASGHGSDKKQIVSIMQWIIAIYFVICFIIWTMLACWHPDHDKKLEQIDEQEILEELNREVLDKERGIW